MGKLKAGMKLIDFIAQATGKQLNKLGSKLGMDKDLLEGLSENQVKGAILDESQKYMRNKRKNINRRVGSAAAAGAASYSVADFIHDMLDISSVADGTLSAEELERNKNYYKKEKKSTPKSESKTISAPPKKPKRKTKSETVLPPPRKPKQSGVTWNFETTKKRTGASDYRKGGMVLSTVDRRKKK